MQTVEHKLYQGDCLHVLRTLPSGSVQCCVTSPPYYNLRNYEIDGQIGMESSPDEYVQKLVDVFREVKRVLKDDGTLWLNLGDSYAGSGGAGNQFGQLERGLAKYRQESKPKEIGLKPKDLMGIPWRVAFALQEEGWWLRQDIIWHKPNPLPESVKDRFTKAHEYVFLLSKSKSYYFDVDAIKEKSIETKSSPRFGGNKYGDSPDPKHATKSGNRYVDTGMRNKRSVWSVTTKPYKGAHFAVMPVDLITPCILAGSAVGSMVLDPFNGSGTVGEVALRNGRSYVGIELNPEYLELTRKRFAGITSPLFFE